MNELNDELDGEVLNYVVELTNGRTEDPAAWDNLSNVEREQILRVWGGSAVQATTGSGWKSIPLLNGPVGRSR